MFHRISKHLEFRQKYSAARRIYPKKKLFLKHLTIKNRDKTLFTSIEKNRRRFDVELTSLSTAKIIVKVKCIMPELSRPMAYTKRKTVNRLARKQLHI